MNGGNATSPCPLPLPVLLLLLLLLMLTLMASAQPTYATVDTSTAARAFCCCRGTVESPKTYITEGWVGGSSSFYRSELTSVAIPRDRALALCFPLCLHLDTSGSLPVIGRASSPTSARPGLSRGNSCSTRSLVRRLGEAGVLSAPGSPARLTPLFARAAGLAVCMPPSLRRARSRCRSSAIHPLSHPTGSLSSLLGTLGASLGGSQSD